MKKRTLIAIILVLAVVLIAQTGAWAGKLQVGSEAPAAAPAEVAGARPHGTGGSGGNNGDDAPYGPPPSVLLRFEEGDIIFIFDPGEEPDLKVEEVPEDAVLLAPESADFVEATYGPKDTLFSALRLTLVDLKLVEDIEQAEDFTGTISYWNGEEWVALKIAAGKVTIPANAPNPLYLAIVP